MANRMDILCPRKDRDGNTRFTKIGVAFETKAGGWSLLFEALPLPTIGDNGALECRAVMMVPRDNAGAAPQRGQQQRGRVDDDLDDSVPF